MLPRPDIQGSTCCSGRTPASASASSTANWRGHGVPWSPGLGSDAPGGDQVKAEAE